MSLMKVSYYPGCSLEATAKPYNISAQEVCHVLGIEMEDVPEWTCCGSSPALKMDRLLSTSLSAHNLALIEKQHLTEVVVPCPFCFRRLQSAQEEIQKDEEVKEQVQEAIEAEIEGKLNIHSLLGFIRREVGLEAIRAKVKKPLKGLKVLPYYGCYLVKPPDVTHFDNPENPSSMDEVLDALGAEVLDWDFKTECCGAGLSLSKTEKVCELSGRLIREATRRGAEALVVACQLCQANLDMRQGEIGKMDKRKYALPILYFTQLMGLAFSLSPQKLGLNHHLVGSESVLKKKGLWG
jgi:heterodisulfide reductase subunit B